MGIPQPQTAMPAAAQLSVVIPTFKERDNVAELLRRLDTALAGVRWEAIFVDDNSPDGTRRSRKGAGGAGPARALPAPRRAARLGRGLHRRDAVIQRAGGGGDRCGSAARRTRAAANARHDPRQRYRSGGGDPLRARVAAAAAFGEGRGAISRIATKLARRVLGTSLSDPMSGFFMMRRDRFRRDCRSPFAGRVQDPPRHRHCRRRPAHRGAALCLR